jgi:hypothetical protein
VQQGWLEALAAFPAALSSVKQCAWCVPSMVIDLSKITGIFPSSSTAGTAGDAYGSVSCAGDCANLKNVLTASSQVLARQLARAAPGVVAAVSRFAGKFPGLGKYAQLAYVTAGAMLCANNVIDQIRAFKRECYTESENRRNRRDAALCTDGAVGCPSMAAIGACTNGVSSITAADVRAECPVSCNATSECSPIGVQLAALRDLGWNGIAWESVGFDPLDPVEQSLVDAMRGSALFLLQMEVFGAMFVGAPFSNSSAPELISDDAFEWMYMDDSDWIAALGATIRPSSPGGAWVADYQRDVMEGNLLRRVNRTEDLEPIPWGRVNGAIARWNATAGYFAYGVETTLIDAELWKTGITTLGAAAEAAGWNNMSAVTSAVTTNVGALETALKTDDDGEINNLPFILGIVILFCAFVVTGVILFRCLRKYEREQEARKHDAQKTPTHTPVEDTEIMTMSLRTSPQIEHCSSV